MKFVRLSFLFLASLLTTVFSQSLRGAHNEERDLIVQANAILSFSFSLVAAKPVNPTTIASCIAGNLQKQTVLWYNSTYPYDKVVSLSIPNIYTKGIDWPGTRHLVTSTPLKKCNYLCITHQILSCRLCGNSRKNHRYLLSNMTNATAVKAANTTNATTITTIQLTNTSNTKATKLVNTTKPTTSKIELYPIEILIEVLLPLVCPGLSGISSVVLTVTERRL